MTIILSLLLVIAFIGVLVFDYLRTRKEISALHPGPYIQKEQSTNPFKDEFAFVKLLEVNNGWVKYHYTVYSAGATAHSMSAKSFVEKYKPYTGHSNP